MTGGQSAVRLNDGHSFPMGGLVELSRATYQSTPLTVIEISPKVFSFIGAGGTVTAVGGSHEYAVIDTGYGPRVPEIRRAIANALDQSPRWLIDPTGTSTTQMETPRLPKIKRRWWAMRTAGRARRNCIAGSRGAACS